MSLGVQRENLRMEKVSHNWLCIYCSDCSVECVLLERAQRLGGWLMGEFSHESDSRDYVLARH